MEMEIQNVAIVGFGTQGSMLAFRCAIYNKNVCLFDVNKEAFQSHDRRI
jgi:3-hydroxyacyl-CoA dehydrogenase